jgi:Leucine-rich repeat (LRR) protein
MGNTTTTTTNGNGGNFLPQIPPIIGTSTSSTLNQKLTNAKVTKRLHLANEKEFNSKKIIWTEFKDMKLIDLSNVNLELLPLPFQEFNTLETLRLDKNMKLTALQPEIMSQLKSLKILTCNDTHLNVCSVLPNSLKTVEFGRCSFTGILEAPQVGFCFCNQLVMLDLSGNRITQLGKAFGFEMLTLLEELNLNDTLLEIIPDDIAQLPRLKTLRLERTKISTIPKVLFANSNVVHLDLAKTLITKETFLKMPGVDIFLERRKTALSKGLAGGVDIDSSLCGLD